MVILEVLKSLKKKEVKLYFNGKNKQSAITIFVDTDFGRAIFLVMPLRWEKQEDDKRPSPLVNDVEDFSENVDNDPQVFVSSEARKALPPPTPIDEQFKDDIEYQTTKIKIKLNTALVLALKD